VISMMTRASFPKAVSVALTVAVLSTGLAAHRSAFAQSSSDSTAAQALFDQAKKLVAEGHAREACPKLEESQKLDPGSGTLVNLANCYERTGRLASAWSKYLEAAAAAKASGNEEREAGARDLAAALVPRLANLVIQVDPKAMVEGLEITRDGEPVGAPQWGLPIPADIGEHVVAAKAPHHRPWKTVAVVKGEGTSTVTLVPPLEPASATEEEAPPPGPGETGLGTQRTLAIVAGGVGVVGLGLGTVFGLKSKSKHDEAAGYCNNPNCPDARGVDAGNDARSSGNVATIGFVIAGLGLGGGIALWVTAPKSAAPAAQVGFGLGSMQIKGAF
jgi:hypothetical protein